MFNANLKCVYILFKKTFEKCEQYNCCNILYMMRNLKIQKDVKS